VIITLSALFILSCTPDFCVNNTGWSTENTPNSDIADNEQEYINLLNVYRSDNTADEFTLDTELTVAAQRHANDMSDRNYFSHTTDVCGWSFSDRAESVGTTANAEIIYQGSADAQSALDSWKDSPDHNEIMLYSSYTYIGVGEKNGYWVAVFR